MMTRWIRVWRRDVGAVSIADLASESPTAGRPTVAPTIHNDSEVVIPPVGRIKPAGANALHETTSARTIIAMAD